MDRSRRLFFGLCAGSAAVPLAAAVRAIAKPPLQEPQAIKPGDRMSSADMNARFDAIWKTIKERT